MTIGETLGTLAWVAVAAAGGWLALVGWLVLQEQRFVFFPTRTLAAGPADFGLRAEELSVPAGDGVRLHGWWIDGPGRRVLIWYHGNAGNIADRLPNARWFVEQLGVAVVLVDYRGYGRSAGTPEAVALEAAFRSVPALARVHYWFVPRCAIRTRMDNESKIGRVPAPMLLLHGDRDRIVPLSHGRRLFERAARPARLHVVAGAGHNDTWEVGGAPYADAWRTFLAETAGPDT